MATKPCRICGSQLVVTAKSRPEPTCQPCRRALPAEVKVQLGLITPRSTLILGKDYTYKKQPCAACGQLAWRSKSGTRDGLTYCRTCPRPAGSMAFTEIVCTCGNLFVVRTSDATNRKYCSRTCSQRESAALRRRARGWAGRKARRADRERVAPGLRWSERKRLMSKWKRQGRSCSFCDNPATTIDHAIPLARGGTNYEGNLIPCCKSCNSSKSDLLTVEWRMRRPHGGTVDRQAVWLDEVAA